MSKFGIPLFVVLVMCYFFFIGFLIGNLIGHSSCEPVDRIAHYKGVISFCDLIEKDRFRVCPQLRAHERLETGGEVTIYVCSDKQLYVETHSLTESSKAVVVAQLQEFKVSMGKVERVCTTKEGAVYQATYQE